MSRSVPLFFRWLVALLVCAALVAVLSMQTAGAVNFFEDVCKQPGSSSSAACEADGENNISGSDGIVLRAANLIAILAGVAAVIMIIIAGLNMVTGGSDSNKVSTAKKTIAFAVVGLVVITLARLIVGFVVTRVG